MVRKNRSAALERAILRRKQRGKKRGIALIMVLGAITILTVFLTELQTDTSAALRAVEIGAQALFKATKVEGIYDRDPVRHEGAQLFAKMTYDHFLANKIGVMDQTAVTLCRENKLPIRVFKLAARGNILRVCMGETIGTIVEG